MTMPQTAAAYALQLHIDTSPQRHEQIRVACRRLARLYVRGLFSLEQAAFAFRFVVDGAARESGSHATLADREALAEAYARWFFNCVQPGGKLDALDREAAAMILEHREGQK